VPGAGQKHINYSAAITCAESEFRGSCGNPSAPKTPWLACGYPDQRVFFYTDSYPCFSPLRTLANFTQWLSSIR
jgi:hypothetical protein